eukprot:4199694-Pleurochrysis_carterae.AAC.1
MHASCYSYLKALLASRHATLVIDAVMAGNLNLYAPQTELFIPRKSGASKSSLLMKLKGFEAFEHKG